LLDLLHRLKTELCWFFLRRPSSAGRGEIGQISLSLALGVGDGAYRSARAAAKKKESELLRINMTSSRVIDVDGEKASVYLATTYTHTTDRVVEPFWRYEEQGQRRYSWGRAECMASAANVCTVLFPYHGEGHKMCMLGVNTKQGSLPGPVRAASVRFSYDLEEYDGGLSYALGYRMPLCPVR
jgi:hypothetical protein